MKSLSGVEKIIFRVVVVVLLAISAWKNVPRSEATAPPRHYPIQVLRRTDGRVARSLLNQMQSTNWSGYVALILGQDKPTPRRKVPGWSLQSHTFLVSRRNTLHPGLESVDFVKTATARL